MIRMTVLGLSLATALVLAPSAAGARQSAYSRVLHVYESHGTIPPCDFTAEELARALRGIDLYGQQYFADFSAAIQNALAQRDAGACRLTGGAAGSAGVGAGQSPGADGSLRLGPLSAPSGAGIPAPLLALGLLTGVGLAGLALVAMSRLRAWDLVPVGPWRHLWSESAWRLGGLRAEMHDWLRSAHRDPDGSAVEDALTGRAPGEPHGP